MNRHQIKMSRKLYGIDSWSAGYFSIADNGHVVCHPHGKSGDNIDLPEVIAAAQERGISMPMILRFPQIITSQIMRLESSFQDAIWEYNYSGRHRGVFPFKVNQRREFIDNVVRCGKDLHYGLEVGTKTELVAALSYRLGSEALLICNGFKDRDFIELGFVAAAMNKNILLVVEGPDELKTIIELAKTAPVCPEIGVRAKLYSRGSGKWVKSSGDSSKFGLTTLELIECFNLVKEANLSEKLTMMHFHIGSQITEIKRVKNAIKEASRVFCKASKMLGFDIKFLNIGGGIGVDYDGSKTSFQSSANYSLQEFANGVVYEIGEVCRDEGVACPDIVTESGRVIAAYHSVVVTDIREVQRTDGLVSLQSLEIDMQDEMLHHKNIKELRYILDNLSRKNYVEFFHDANEYYDEILTLFNLGFLDLRERGAAEHFFYQICHRALLFSNQEINPLEEFVELQQRMVSKYMANFSIFQSIPDAWAIDQLFPVMPLSHHEEKPTHRANIVDITCDSDGCLQKFIDKRDVSNVLDLHDPGDRPYYLGFFLVGAYQESLANEHNLLGAINEAEIILNAENSWEINKITEGDPIEELLVARNYDISDMISSYREQLCKGNNSQNIEILKRMLRCLPYLNPQTE